MRRSVQLITLRCALVVAEEGSFLGASRRMRIHHSALSRRIRDLEHSLGAAVFERHSGGVRPTEPGARFLRNLRRVLTDLEGTFAMVETAGRGENGSLSIGFNASLLAGETLDTVTGFMQDLPNIDIRFIEAPSAGLTAGLSARTIDVVIAPGGRERDTCLPLWRDRLLVAMAANHPLAGRKAIDWIELGGQTLLADAQSTDSGLISRIAAFSELPSFIQHDISRVNLLGLVVAGMGIALLPASDAAPRHDGIVFSELRRAGKPVNIRYFAEWRLDNKNPVLAAFIGFLKKRYSLR
jgi:DNA-binding transcriptional LysR family regulator